MKKFLSLRLRRSHDRTLKRSLDAAASPKIREQKARREEAPYIYSRLEEGYIRILVLLPGVYDDPLSCQLLPVKFSEAPEYHALSYVWGDEGVKDVLYIGEKAFKITFNLRDALTRLRFQHRPIYIWADAVCINQADLVEKADQVQLMGLIYYRATRVNVWLGNLSSDEQTGVEVALECMARVISLYRADMAQFGDNLPVYSSSILMFPDQPPWNEWKSWVDHTGWEALRLLFERPWFKRVWVVQEVGLAKDVLYLFDRSGRLGFNWNDLRLLMEWFDRCGDVVARYFEIDMRQYKLVRKYLESTRDDGKKNATKTEDFLEILDGSRGFQFSNLLDSVYAFLGHPTAIIGAVTQNDHDIGYEELVNNGSPIILPDYTKKTLVLYYDLAVAIIRDSLSGSQILRYVEHVNESSLDNSLPSWVPRWDLSSAPRAFAPSENLHYQASGSLPRRSLIIYGDTHLKMKAIRIGLVDFARSFQEPSWFFIWGTKFRVLNNAHTVSDEDANPIEDLLATFESLRQSLPNARLNDTVACCVTLTAGLTKTSQPVSKCQKDHFANFCAYRLAKADRWGPDFLPSTRIQLEEGAVGGDADQYFCDVERACSNRAFFQTDQGYIGLGPKLTGKRDEVWLPVGSKVPFVLRPMSGKYGHCYKVLGQAYVHGIMEGEAVRGVSEEAFHDLLLC